MLFLCGEKPLAVILILVVRQDKLVIELPVVAVVPFVDYGLVCIVLVALILDPALEELIEDLFQLFNLVVVLRLPSVNHLHFLAWLDYV